MDAGDANQEDLLNPTPQNTEERLAWLRKRGINTDWYYKAKKNRRPDQPASTRSALVAPETCGMLSLLHIRYHGGQAHISTTRSDGSPYKEVAVEETKKTGEPVWWCNCCNKVFADYDAAVAHYAITGRPAGDHPPDTEVSSLEREAADPEDIIPDGMDDIPE